MRKGYINKCLKFIGKKFNYLKIVKLLDKNDSYGRIMCECVCDCGNVCELALRRVVSGHNQTCGKCDLQFKRISEIKRTNILELGDSFGWLTPIRPTNKRKWDQILWLCRCKCGREVYVTSRNLKEHRTGSCGKCGYQSHRIHLLKTIYDTPDKKRLARIYFGMKKRCYNPNCDDYKNYGGRGIVISEDWSTPIKFINWGLNNGYAKNLTIDRIDVNGPYAPWNCRWATKQEQAKNTRSNVFITVNGTTHVLSDWDRILGKYAGFTGRFLHLNGEAATKLCIENLLHGIPSECFPTVGVIDDLP